jgi:hypothetical protein
LNSWQAPKFHRDPTALCLIHRQKGRVRLSNRHL